MARPATGGANAWRAAYAGVLLAASLAMVAKLVSSGLGAWLTPGRGTPVSAVLCAVLLGVLWRNCFGTRTRWDPGLQWITSRLLQFGIALVGLRLTFDGVAAVGTVAVPVVLSCIVTALLASAVVGRILGLSPPLRKLIAVGTAVCGCTAVVATAPFVRARPEETGLALTCVVLFGCAAMLLYPWLAEILFATDTVAGAVFLGTAIHDTSQVLGASLIYAQQFNHEAAVPIAGLTKLLRNLSLLILIPYFGALTSRAHGDLGDSAASTASLRRSQVLPAFLIWFVVLALVRLVGDKVFREYHAGWQQALDAALAVSEFCLVSGMTAVGMSVCIRVLPAVGWRALAASFVTAILVGLCSITVTLVTQRLAL